MFARLPLVLTLGVLAWAPALMLAQEADAPPNNCLMCHGDAELWEDDQKKFHVTEDLLKTDIHWSKGLRCADCHGGDPAAEDYSEAHDEAKGFRAVKTPKDVPGFCGHCHADPVYMKRFNPAPRTDQLAEFWTSGHGKHLEETGDPKVATCVSCHSHHDIRAVKDLESPVYPTRVAETCNKCHGDASIMDGRLYNDRPLGHGQYELWKKSVHGRAMIEKQDIAAPTCNDCHGNHGALPPEIGTVANACGSCHGKVAELFTNTVMSHKFTEAGLPGCATCHGAHEIKHPTDEMLGMQEGAVCAQCHAEGKHGATITGAENARKMKAALEDLKERILEADGLVLKAEHLGMEVGKPRFELQSAQSALTNARTLIHSFALDPVMKVMDKGISVADSVKGQAEGALEEHTSRRIWLAGSLVFIGLLVALLLMYVKRFPTPEA